jgi:hypothetical protein
VGVGACGCTPGLLSLRAGLLVAICFRGEAVSGEEEDFLKKVQKSSSSPVAQLIIFQKEQKRFIPYFSGFVNTHA